MSAINTALSILCPALIKRSALDHIISCSKKKKKTPKRPANFLAFAESASGSDSLIIPFIIKPGYLPEQPVSHVPGESATHFLGVSGNGSYSAEMTEEKAIGSPFRTWVSRSKDKRKREKGEGQTVSPKPGGKRWKWSRSRSLGGNVDLDVFQHQCQPMSN